MQRKIRLLCYYTVQLKIFNRRKVLFNHVPVLCTYIYNDHNLLVKNYPLKVTVIQEIDGVYPKKVFSYTVLLQYHLNAPIAFRWTGENASIIFV